MKLAERMDTLEENLTPKELVILWMREAHEFGDLMCYGRWLLDQPDDAYPLIRLPRLLYEGSPVAKSRVCEPKDREALRAGYRDLLFLYHLHSQMNERVIRDAGELRFRSLYLKERLQRLIEEHEHPRVQVRGGRPRRPRITDETPSEQVQAQREIWLGEMDALATEVHGLLGAERLLSRRYLAGDDLLFPDARDCLSFLAEAITTLRRIERLTFGDLETKFITLAEVERMKERGDEVPAPAKEAPSPAARRLAQELVVLARAEALTHLGEQERGVDLVAEWMRGEGR